MSDIAFVRGDKKKNYTILDNTCIQDEQLSWGAKGLHCYLEHLPGNWILYKNYLITHFPDKRVALNNLIKELVNAGYIEVEKGRRNPDGTFAPQRYIVFEKPKNDQCRLSTVDNSTADNPLSDNQHLLNTNLPITNLTKTEQTNCKPEQMEQSNAESQPKAEEVSESVFIITIKELFNAEYPFDKYFEQDVITKLAEYKISKDCIGDYLSYVFERTKLAKPKKSFEGLYRTLALSSSVARDFINCSVAKKSNNVASDDTKIFYINCPVCGKKFDRYVFYCPECNASVDDIENHDERNLEITKRLYQMSSERRDAFYKELETRSMGTSRRFLNTEERNQLYKDFGLID